MRTPDLRAPAGGPPRWTASVCTLIAALMVSACIDPPRPWVPDGDATGPDVTQMDGGNAGGDASPDGATGGDVPDRELPNADVDCGERLAPSPGRIGDAQRLCPEEAAADLVDLGLPTGGTPPFTFRWERRPWAAGEAALETDWETLEGAVEADRLELPDAPPEGSQAYRRVVIDACGAEAASDEVVVEASPLSGGSIAGAEGACDGQQVGITSVGPATGGRGAFTYAWERKVGDNAWETVSGRTGEAVDATPAAGGILTVWRRIATNGCGIPTRSNAIAIAGHAPLVAGRIAGPDFACANESGLVLSEVEPMAGGTGDPTHRWEQRSASGGGWETISDATSPALTLVEPLTETTTFRRMDRNTCGEVTTNDVTVRAVAGPGQAVTSPDQALCAGASPTSLAVTYATDEVALGHQWQSSSDGETFTDIAGATQASYRPGPAEISTWYRRRTDWPCGATLSRAIRVAVHPPLEPGAVGDPQELCADSPADRLSELTSPTGGSGRYQYRWEQRSGSTDAWEPTGASGAEFEPGLLTATAEFRRVVQDVTCGGEAGTEAVRIVVAARLEPGLLRSAQLLCRGVEATPLESARPASGGLGERTFRWEASSGGGGFQVIPGATGEVYAPGLLSASTVFRRRVLNRCGEAATPNVAIQLRPTFQPGVIGANQTLCNGRAPNRLESLQPASGGGGSFIYRWEEQRGNGPWEVRADGDSEALDPPPLGTTTRYRRFVREDVCGHTGTTNEVALTVAAPFTPGEIVAPTRFCPNGELRLRSVRDAVGGLGAVAYAWQRQGLTGWLTVSGATGSELTWQAGTTEETFRRAATNTCGQSVAETVTTRPADPVTAGSIAGAQTVCAASEVRPLASTSPGAGGLADVTYRWESSIDGVTWQTVAGATAAELAPIVTQTTRLRRVHVNGCGEAATADVTVTVTGSVDPGVITGPGEACPGTSPGLVTGTPAEVEGDEPAAYTWQILDPDGRWVQVPGATGRDLDPGLLVRTTSLRRVIASSCGDVPSNEVVIAVPERSGGEIAGPMAPVCHGASVALASRAEAVGAGELGYTWESRTPAGTWTLVPEATGATAEVGDLNATREFRRVTRDRCGDMPTTGVTVEVLASLSPGTIAPPASTCHNRPPSPVTSTSPATGGSGSFAYSWERLAADGWGPVSGQTEASLAFDVPQTASSVWRRRVEDRVCGGSAATSSVDVSIAAPLAGGTLAGGQSLCLGEAVSPIVELAPPTGGLGLPTWSWQRSTDGVVWDLVPGAAGPTLAAPDAVTTASYRRLVTNACGTAATVPVQVQVAPTLEPGVIGQSQQVCAGQPATTLAEQRPASGGTGPYSWHWEESAGACDATGGCAAPLVIGGAASGTARIAWSDDAGTSWLPAQLPPGLVGASVTALEASPTAVIAVLDDTVLRSTDGGRTFVEITVPISKVTGPRVTALRWRGGRWFAGGRAQIAVSTDDGATWTLRYPSSLGSTPTHQLPFLAFAMRGTEIVAAAAGDGPYVFALSLQSGNTWDHGPTSNATNMPGSGADCSHVMVDASASRYFAGASSICDGISYDLADLWVNSAQVASGNWQRLTATGFSPRFWGLGVSADGDAMFLGGASLTSANRVAWLAAGSNTPVVRPLPGDANGVTGGSRVVAVGDTWYVVRSFAAGQASILTSKDDGQTWSALVEPGFSVRALAGGLAARPATWVRVANATGSTLTPTGVTAPRTYRRVIRDALCQAEAFSNPVVLSPAPNLDPGALQSASTICEGSSATIDGTATTSGLTPVSYRWYTRPDASSTWQAIVGATAEDLVTGPLTTGATFRRETSDRCGPANAPDITVTVAPSPDPGLIAGTQNLCGEQTPTPLVSIREGSGGLGDGRYQWQVSDDQQSWSDVPGAAADSYQPPSTTVRRFYRRAWLTGCAPVHTQSVYLEPGGDVDAGVIAGDQAICLGRTPATLTSTTNASGATFTYVWQLRTPGGAWVEVPDANGATLVPPAVSFTTEFRRQAVDATCGAASSNIVTVTVAPLDAGAIDSARTVCRGAIPPPVGSVRTASGGVGPYTYVWQSSPVETLNWTTVPGANGTTLALTDPPSTSVKFRRLAVSTCNENRANSNVMTLTVAPALLGGTIDGTQTICDGATPAPLGNVTAASGGQGTLSYVWQQQLAGHAAFEDIPGATGATYAPPVLSTTTTFRRRATNGCGSENSNDVTVTVAPAITAGTVVASQTICSGVHPAQLGTGVAPSGGIDGFTWRWESSTDGNVFTPVTGATGESLAPGGLTQTTHFRRVNTNSCGQAVTPAILVSVRASLTPGTIASGQNICHDTAPAAFTGTSPTGGSGDITYQWQSVGPDGAWRDLPGATGAGLTRPALRSNLRLRRNVLDGTCAQGATSNELLVTVAQPVSGGTVATPAGAAAQTLCSGAEPAAFRTLLAASGGLGGFTYRWYERVGEFWQTLVGATSEEYRPATTTPAVETTRIFRRLAVNTTCGFDPTPSVTVTVRAPLSAGSITGAQTICHSAHPATLTSTAEASGGSGTRAYLWERSLNGLAWTSIEGANRATYTPDALTSTTHYRRKVVDAQCGQAIATPVIVTVRSSLSAGTIGGASEVCSGAAPGTFTNVAGASGGAGNFTYRWETSSDGLVWHAVQGAAGTTWTPPVFTTTTRVRRVVTDGVCATDPTTAPATAPLTVTIAAPLEAGEVAASQALCAGEALVAFSSERPATGGLGTLSYQWYARTAGTNFEPVSGATSLVWSPTEVDETTEYLRRATNRCGTADTAPLEVEVRDPVAPGSLGSTITLCKGAGAPRIEPTAPTGGGGVYSYQWQESIDETAGGFQPIPGENGATYKPTDTSVSRWYRRVVTESTCSTVIDSDPLLVEVTSGTPGEIAPEQMDVCPGAPTPTIRSLSPGLGGGRLTYAWETATDDKMWALVNGANDEDLPGTGTLSVPTSWRRIVTHDCGTQTTEPVTVTIRPAVDTRPSSAIATPLSTICATSRPPLLSVIDASNNIYSPSLPPSQAFAWQRERGSRWEDIEDASTASWQPESLTATTRFRRVIRDRICGFEQASAPVTVTVVNTISPGTIEASRPTSCAATGTTNELRQVTAASGPGEITYTWQRRVDPADWQTITGATGTTYAAPTGSPSSITYRRVASDACGTATSNEVIVQALGGVDGGGVSPLTQTVCYGQPAQTIQSTRAASGVGVLAYLWEETSDPASNASRNWKPTSTTSASFTPPTLSGTSGAPSVSTLTKYYRRRAIFGGCNGQAVLATEAVADYGVCTIGGL